MWRKMDNTCTLPQQRHNIDIDKNNNRLGSKSLGNLLLSNENLIFLEDMLLPQGFK